MEVTLESGQWRLEGIDVPLATLHSANTVCVVFKVPRHQFKHEGQKVVVPLQYWVTEPTDLNPERIVCDLVFKFDHKRNIDNIQPTEIGEVEAWTEFIRGMTSDRYSETESNLSTHQGERYWHRSGYSQPGSNLHHFADDNVVIHIPGHSWRLNGSMNWGAASFQVGKVIFARPAQIRLVQIGDFNVVPDDMSLMQMFRPNVPK
jgi:hypothetical protein